MEIWKDIEGYGGKYQVSNKGKVRSLKGKGRILKQKRLRDTYFYINLYHKGTCKTESVHRLIAKTFIPNPMDKPCVNHIDGNKENNASDNLEWTTYRENNTHALKTGLKTYGSIPVKLTKLSDGSEVVLPSKTQASVYLKKNKRFVSQCLYMGKNTVDGYLMEEII